MSHPVAHGVVTGVGDVPPGHWIAASVRLRRLVVGPPVEIYPCVCHEFDDDPPEWLKDAVRREGGDPGRILRCRPYVAKKGKRAGRWWSYCDCWGRRREEGLPGNCCAWHEGNPAYTVGSTLSIVDQKPATVFAASNLPEPDDGLDDEQRILLDMDTTREPYVRRFTPAEVTCPCPTPWDGITDARKVGYHCPACCHNFTNWSRAQAHQKHVTDRCKDPATQVTIDGEPVYRAGMLGRFVVWS